MRFWGFWRNCIFNSQKQKKKIEIYIFKQIFSQNAASSNFPIRERHSYNNHSQNWNWCYILTLHATSYTHTTSYIPAMFWRIQSNRQVHLELFHRNPDTLRRARHTAKPDHLIQVNYWEVHTHASCGTASIWQSFKHWGTKLFLLSDELWFTGLKKFCKQG